MKIFNTENISLCRRVTAAFVTLTALVVYWLTCDPDVSYWDCPEYVLTASTMQIGHPPGNPVWMLAMRAVTIPFPTHLHAVVINACSGLLTALAAGFLTLVIFRLAQGIFKRRGDWCALTSATGGLTFTFLDSTWFSAVEAEVYAFSAFLTSFTIWLMLHAMSTADTPHRRRLLILTAYLLGLSIGVHQLNLLIIPVLTLIYTFRRHPLGGATWRAWGAIIAGCAIVGLLLTGLMGGSLALASQLELFAVNTLHLPYTTGLIAFPLLGAMLFAMLLWGAGKWGGRISGRLITAIWMAGMVCVGYSAIAVILIRGAASPPINEGAPSDIFALRRYVAREQYGSTPLLYGQTPYSRPVYQERWLPGRPLPDYSRYALEGEHPIIIPVMEGARLNNRSGLLTGADSAANETVERRATGYLTADYRFRQVMTPELNMWLPRITSSNPALIPSYADWAGMTKETMERVKISTALDTLGQPTTRLLPFDNREEAYGERPTYLQNLRFFITYQAGFMYFRYLMWNFFGREIDNPADVEGWHDIKWMHLYYGIPFLAGIAGIIFLMLKGRQGRRQEAVVTLFFLMTGLAIVVYLNQSPGEPRERDYAFIGSFMAFCIWVGYGTAAIGRLAGRALRSSRKGLLCATALASGMVTLLATENWPDHDRSGRFETAAFASNMLEGAEDDIIFTYGDNYTFPLWYAQQMLGENTGGPIIDVSYFATPEYVVNLMKQGDRGIRTIATPADVAYGAYAFTRVQSDADTTAVPLTEALRELYASRDGTPVFKHSRVTIPGRSLADTLTIDLRKLAGVSGLIPFRKLMILDIVAANTERPDPKCIAFLSVVPDELTAPLTPALRKQTFYNVYAPQMSDSLLTERRKLVAKAIKRSFEGERPHYIDPVIADQRRRQKRVLADEEKRCVNDSREGADETDNK